MSNQYKRLEGLLRKYVVKEDTSEKARQEASLKKSIWGGGGNQRISITKPKTEKGKKILDKKKKEFVDKFKGVPLKLQNQIRKGTASKNMIKLYEENPYLVGIYLKIKKRTILTQTEKKKWKDHNVKQSKKRNFKDTIKNLDYSSVKSEETTYKGKTGKWITIRGRKIFLEDT